MRGSTRASPCTAHRVILMSADHTATHSPDVADERLRRAFVARLTAVTHHELDLVFMERETSKLALPPCLTTPTCIAAEHSDDFRVSTHFFFLTEQQTVNNQDSGH